MSEMQPVITLKSRSTALHLVAAPHKLRYMSGQQMGFSFPHITLISCSHTQRISCM